MIVVCFYHKNCSDGAAAAWVVKRKFPEALMYAIDYDDPVPEIPDGADLYIVDFSFKTVGHYENLAMRCNTVTVIDHHETATHALGMFLDVSPHLMIVGDFERSHHNVTVRFDKERCGATLTWAHLFPREPVPRFLKHIEDRDLHRYRMGGTRELHHHLAAINFDISKYEDLCDEEYLTSVVLHNRMTVEEWDDKVQSFVTMANALPEQELVFNGEVIPVRVMPLPAEEWFTDVTSAMNNDPEISPLGVAMAYVPVKAEGLDVRYRISSINSAFHAGNIAMEYGGGGHPGAAGFSVSPDKHKPGELASIKK